MVDWMDRKTDGDRQEDRYLNRELEREQFTHFYLVNFWTVFDGFRSAGKLKHEGNRCKRITCLRRGPKGNSVIKKPSQTLRGGNIA